jgi:hypothetical protein
VLCLDLLEAHLGVHPLRPPVLQEPLCLLLFLAIDVRVLLRIKLVVVVEALEHDLR